jgi:hypothetical protein
MLETGSFSDFGLFGFWNILANFTNLKTQNLNYSEKIQVLGSNCSSSGKSMCLATSRPRIQTPGPQKKSPKNKTKYKTQNTQNCKKEKKVSGFRAFWI